MAEEKKIDSNSTVEILNPSIPSIEEIDTFDGKVDEKDDVKDLELEEIKDEPEEELDEEETEEEESEDEETEGDEDESEEDEKEEEEPESEKDTGTLDKDYLREADEIQKRQSDISKQIGIIANSLMEAPTKPTGDDEYDDDIMGQYRTDISLYRSEVKKAEAQVNRLKAEIKEEGVQAQSLFIQNHPGENLEKFERWVAAREHFYVAWVSGDLKIEHLYNLYKDVTSPANEAKKVKRLMKKGIKFKPVNIKTKSVPRDVGKGGMPKKYKYANMPAMKEFVADLKAQKVGRDGQRFTNDRIERMSRDEYMIMSGKSPI